MISEDLRRLRDAITTCEEGAPLLSVTVPIATPSTANLREHHHAKAKRVAAQRVVTGIFLRGSRAKEAGYPDLRGGLVVCLTRRSPRRLDDDNLANALKAVRDSVAAWLGVDDGDARVTFVPDQTKSKTASVLVEIYCMRGET